MKVTSLIAMVAVAVVSIPKVSVGPKIIFNGEVWPHYAVLIDDKAYIQLSMLVKQTKGSMRSSAKAIEVNIDALVPPYRPRLRDYSTLGGDTIAPDKAAELAKMVRTWFDRASALLDLMDVKTWYTLGADTDAVEKKEAELKNLKFEVKLYAQWADGLVLRPYSLTNLTELARGIRDARFGLMMVSRIPGDHPRWQGLPTSDVTDGLRKCSDTASDMQRQLDQQLRSVDEWHEHVGGQPSW